MLANVQTLSVLVLLLAGAWVELSSGLIPNWLVGLGLLASVALTAADGLVATHVAGLALAAFLSVTSWRRGWMGGGAAKLVIAMGACAGLVTTGRTEAAFTVLVGVALAGRGRVWGQAPLEVAGSGGEDRSIALAPYFAAAFVLQEVAVRVLRARNG